MRPVPAPIRSLMGRFAARLRARVGGRSGGLWRAFSLVEVLIAVVVVSLGLLGIAAVFPVVVFQQRVAVDRTQGVSAAAAAEAWLRNSEDMTRRDADTDDIDNDSGGFEWLREAPEDAPFPPSLDFQPDFSPQGVWRTPYDPAGDQFSALNLRTGDLAIRTEDNGNAVSISLAQRLVPGPYASASEPQYVWDLAMRRVLDNVDSNGDPFATPEDAIEVAVFVRRIDSGIRVPSRSRDGNPQLRAQYGRNLRLSDVLMQDRANNEFGADLDRTEYRVPVSVETIPGADRGVGRPRNDGVVGLSPGAGGSRTYGVPFRIPILSGEQYGPDDLPRNRIPLEPGLAAVGGDPEALFDIAAQPRQKLVDGLGNVYEVRGVDQSAEAPNEFTLIVDPPVPDSVGSTTELARRLRPEDVDEPDNAVVLTPKPPVAVRVFRVSK